MHNQVKGFTVNPRTLINQQSTAHPSLGEFSVLVLAAAVAHQMEVVAPPKLWASILVNQQPLVVPPSESCSVKDEYGTPVFSQSVKKAAGQAQSESKLVESGPFVNSKLVARKTQGCILIFRQFVAVLPLWIS